MLVRGELMVASVAFVSLEAVLKVSVEDNEGGAAMETVLHLPEGLEGGSWTREVGAA